MKTGILPLFIPNNRADISYNTWIKTYKHTGDTNEQKGEWKILDFLTSFAQEFKVKYKK